MVYFSTLLVSSKLSDSGKEVQKEQNYRKSKLQLRIDTQYISGNVLDKAGFKTIVR